MKSIDEVEYKVFEYYNPKRWTYEPLIKQSLEWALEKMREHPESSEFRIRKRISRLQEKQVSKERMAFYTRPARAVQINALKWVVGEYDLDRDEPIKKEK